MLAGPCCTNVLRIEAPEVPLVLVEGRCAAIWRAPTRRPAFVATTTTLSLAAPPGPVPDIWVAAGGRSEGDVDGGVERRARRPWRKAWSRLRFASSRPCSIVTGTCLCALCKATRSLAARWSNAFCAPMRSANASCSAVVAAAVAMI